MKTMLASIMKEELFHVDIEPFENKDDLFDTCVRWLAEANIVNDTERVKEALYYRESLGSTYLGNYIALPHAKGVGIERSSVLFCRTKSPFWYQSDDEVGEVKYIFMLIIPDGVSNNGYLRVLASIARLLAKDEFIRRLDEFKTSDDFINCALELDEGDLI